MESVRLTPQRWAVLGVTGAGALILALMYLVQWLEMPLYPDEVAFRLLRSRYLVDGVTSFGLLPCMSNAQPIPIVFRPAAYALSIVDFELAWSMVRAAPLAGILLTLMATLAILLYRGAFAASLITTAGFIGVVGSGLLLSRGEAPMLFLSFMCLVGYMIVTRREVPAIVSGLFLVAATSTALLAFFVHVQAVILAPVVILTAGALIARTPHREFQALAGLSIALVFLGALGAFSYKTSCSEYPSVALFFAKSELPGLLHEEGLAGTGSYLWEKLPRYVTQFVFKSSYDIGYIPGISGGSYGSWLSPLNTAIESAVIFNILLAGTTMIVTGAITAATLLRKRQWVERLKLLTGMPAPYLFLGLAGHLALFIYDVPTGFYRSFHIHLMLVLLNCMALSALRGKAGALLWPISIASVAVSLCSAIVSFNEMHTKFAAGWTGPSIGLATDWVAVRNHVSKLSQSCKIEDTDSGIVVDDLTYDAMRRHPHLIPVTYLGFAIQPKPSDTATLYKLLHAVSATAVVTRCGVLPIFGLPPEHRSNGVCCLKLPAYGASSP